jgi:hypothetical protein
VADIIQAHGGGGGGGVSSGACERGAEVVTSGDGFERANDGGGGGDESVHCDGGHVGIIDGTWVRTLVELLAVLAFPLPPTDADAAADALFPCNAGPSKRAPAAAVAAPQSGTTPAVRVAAGEAVRAAVGEAFVGRRAVEAVADRLVSAERLIELSTKAGLDRFLGAYTVVDLGARSVGHRWR